MTARTVGPWAVADLLAERATLIAALEEAFIALGKAGGNASDGTPYVRAAWLTARAALTKVQS